MMPPSTVSPISADARRLKPDSFGLGLDGRPAMRAIAARFGFLAFGRYLGIAGAPLAFCVAMFSDNCLKKWCHLPPMRCIGKGLPENGGITIACLGGELSGWSPQMSFYIA
jgi:hypothetical protein